MVRSVRSLRLGCRKARRTKPYLTMGSTRCVSTPRMGQQHPSPGQSVATERREAPPWVIRKHPFIALKGQYKIGASIMVYTLNRLFGPFRAAGVFACSYPGRRCALPWARLFKPVGLTRIIHGVFTGQPQGASPRLWSQRKPWASALRLMNNPG